jgi:neurotransmitter:Na+ symporter, NSS family
MSTKNEQWSSNFGFLMAAIASAVGLGSIWRFPYLVGIYGGSAFIIMYTFVIMIVGILGLAAEIALGRNSGLDAVESFTLLTPKGSVLHYISKVLGYLGVITGFILMTFYSVIGGWILFYLFKSLSFQLDTLAVDHFRSFIASDAPIYWQMLFIGCTVFVVGQGVSSGIERYSKWMNILLFSLIIIIALRSVSLSGSSEGIYFLLRPDFKIFLDPSVWLVAVGQALFSLSLGMAIMVTYGSYLPKSANILQSSFVIAISTVFIAVLMGFAIFPAVFAMGFSPDSGPGLLFVVLPQVFNSMPLGGIFAILFFAATLFAALTSAISLIEPVIARLMKVFSWSRKRATSVLTIILLLISLPVAMAHGRTSSITIAELNLFDALDFLTDKILLPFNLVVIFIFVGWVWGKRGFLLELSNQGSLKIPAPKLLLWMIRLALPFLVVLPLIQKFITENILKS